MCRYIFLLTIFLLFHDKTLQQSIKILFLTDKNQTFVPEWTAKILKNIENNLAPIKMDDQFLNVEFDKETEQIEQFCNLIGSGISLIVDLSLPQISPVFINVTNAYGIPYVKLDIAIDSFVQALDHYLVKRNATDAALILAKESDIDQAIAYFIGQSILRIIVLDGNNAASMQKLGEMRPSPSYYAIFGSTAEIREIYNLANKLNLIYRYDRWNLVFFDYDYDQFLMSNKLNTSVSVLYPKDSVACRITFQDDTCQRPTQFDVFEELLKSFLNIIVTSVKNSDLEVTKYDCSVGDSSEFTNETRTKFYAALTEELTKTQDDFELSESTFMVTLNYEMSINMINDNGEMEEIAQWNSKESISLNANKEIKPTKAYYRIGTAEAVPWSFPIIDRKTGEIALHPDGTQQWTGYCIDLIDILAEKMNFDYELVIPKNGTFGKKVGPDKWDGIVGDLKEGRTDIAVAALTMTAEREEVIDFVAPYFEQTGIIIVMRKPIRQTSMFKFMTVLKTEVWISILGALIVTAVLLWILDTFSPYSARNNKKAYPYPCRVFTLKESFWFALTSFTPQGGGEAPKAISGRTLVAAYWLFVVLMLATFTANLAAFLTVERMQTPVQSLEQLARQSRINYTVVEGSTTHEYFKNMKNAEDTLYRLWKELTLNATSDQSQYRVWDYPIKEQYGHILSAIMETGTLANASVGFQKVLEHDDFAFIHDSSQIKYEVSRNCNFTTIGELFAEQPFALAVQQGSHLQEELSKVILELQKNRIFEMLTNRYWNSSERGACSDASDSEGISLESLGGVFIATLFGLALAMITLAGEVIYYKRKERNIVRVIDDKPPAILAPTEKPFKSPKLITIGKTFKPVSDKIPKVSHISVFPRNTFQP